MTVPPTTTRSGPGSRGPPITRSSHPPRASSTDASHRAPLPSLSRARKSSTTRRFYERDRQSAYARTACSLMVEVRDRTPARLPPTLTSRCPITPDLAARFADRARIAQRFSPLRKRQKPRGGERRALRTRARAREPRKLSLPNPTCGGFAVHITRPRVSPTNDRRNTAWPGLSRRACAFVRQ